MLAGELRQGADKPLTATRLSLKNAHGLTLPVKAYQLLRLKQKRQGIPCPISSVGLNNYYLSAVVITALGAESVRSLVFAAVGAFNQCGSINLPHA